MVTKAVIVPMGSSGITLNPGYMSNTSVSVDFTIYGCSGISRIWVFSAKTRVPTFVKNLRVYVSVGDAPSSGITFMM